MSKEKPGVWSTKAHDQFTVKLPLADAAAACIGAVTDAKGWRIHESGPDRIIAVKGPGLVELRTYYVEVLLTEAGAGETALALTGWTMGKGAGMNKMVSRVTGELRAAIEGHASK